MKKIMFLCPYFGKLPAHTPLWLNSIAANSTVMWHLITDDKTPYPYPKNVQVTYTTLEDLRERFQTKFDFRISLPGVYKLGDYKPLFGYLFEEELKGYDAWGHIDVADEIYGDIRHFITDELLEKYDKIMLFGHMCIYKNTPEVNRRFMASTGTQIDYQDIFSSAKFYNFEEIAPNSITRIYQHNGWPIGRLDDVIADISGLSYAFRLGKWSSDCNTRFYLPHVPRIFSYENGKTFSYSVHDGKQVIKKEYLYVHFKRRKMKQEVSDEAKEFCIVPSGFVAKPTQISADFIKKHSKGKLFYKVYWNEKKKGLLRRWKKCQDRLKNYLIAFAKKVATYLPDKQFLQLKYWYIFRKRLNLENPQTFNEKLQWLKLYDHNPLYTTLVDKYAVKKWVADKIGEQYTIPTLGVWDKPEDIDFDVLPNQFVLKCTHDSGSIVICKDKNTFNRTRAIAQLKRGLSNNFYVAGREWPYKNVSPRIIAETYLQDESNRELKDYKIFCFQGIAHYIQLDFNRFTNHQRNYYDPSWHFLPFSTNGYYSDPNRFVISPNKLTCMLELANKLSKNLPFVRVDFYLIKDQILFGKMTFFPVSGFGCFSPEKYDIIFGNLLRLPSHPQV